MKALTRLERRALGLASNKAGASIVVARKHIDGSKDVTRAVANRLTLSGLAAVSDGRLRITAEGQRVLKAPLPEDPDVFLKEGDGLTTSRKCALVAEGPVLDTATLEGFWKEQSLRSHAATTNGRQHARQLKRAARNWPTSGPVGPVTTHFDPGVIDADAA